MCLFKLFKKKGERVSTEQLLSLSIDHGTSFTCSYKKKRHLVIRGSIRNDSDKPIVIRTRILPRGKLVASIVKCMGKNLPGEYIVYNSRPQIAVSATITDAPCTIAAFSTESFTLIVVDFNMYDKMEIEISYEGGVRIVPIDPNVFATKQI